MTLTGNDLRQHKVPLPERGEGVGERAVTAAVAPATDAPGSNDEWSPLREVIVGTAAYARIPSPVDVSAWLNLYGDLDGDQVRQVRAGAFGGRLIEETEEDLALLAATLERMGVRVHRPDPVDHGHPFSSPDWDSDGGLYSYCPRDLALVVGSAIIETPSPMRARAHELTGLKSIFQERMLAGSPWIAAPRPRLPDGLYGRDPQGRPVLGETEPVFEAANVLRMGEDLLYQVSGSGNELGLHWLRTTLAALGQYRVHPLRGLYAGTHIDSTLALIRPGLVLANPARVTAENLPAALRGWEVLWCPAMTGSSRGSGTAARPDLSSEWIGMNLLMVRPDLAIVDETQHALHRALRSRGVEVVPLPLRHAGALGGGFHCVTLDLIRDTGAR